MDHTALDMTESETGGVPLSRPPARLCDVGVIKTQHPPFHPALSQHLPVIVSTAWPGLVTGEGQVAPHQYSAANTEDRLQGLLVTVVRQLVRQEPAMSLF